MKKNHFIVILFTFFFNNLLAQAPLISRMSAAVEYRGKTNLYYKTAEFNDVAVPVKGLTSNNFAFSLRYRFHQRAVVETGYWAEYFYSSFELPSYYGIRYMYLVEAADMVPIRCYLDAVKVNLFKRPLRLSSSLGGALGLSRNKKPEPYYSPKESSQFIKVIVGFPGQEETFELLRESRYGKEHGLNKYFWVFEGRLEASYEILPFVALYGGVGYTLGTQAIGRMRVYYTKSPAPPEVIELESNGSSHAWFVGIRATFEDIK